MRRFSVKVDLRKGPQPTRAVQVVQQSDPSRDGLVLSENLAPKRKAMREWADFQRALMALPTVTSGPSGFEDRELAEEYVRIYNVTREKILEAAPGFEQADKLEQHCYFEPDGSKHVVSRLLARPHMRVTELSLYPNGEINRVYYEQVGGPEQNLDTLYENGLGGLEEDQARFARYPNYRLKLVVLPCRSGRLSDIYRATSVFDPALGAITTEEEPNEP